MIEKLLTIYRSLSRKHHYYKLQTLVCVLQISEHGLYLIRTSGIFTEARLTYHRHTGIIRDPLQLCGKVPKRQTEEDLLKCVGRNSMLIKTQHNFNEGQREFMHTCSVDLIWDTG